MKSELENSVINKNDTKHEQNLFSLNLPTHPSNIDAFINAEPPIYYNMETPSQSTFSKKFNFFS